MNLEEIRKQTAPAEKQKPVAMTGSCSRANRPYDAFSVAGLSLLNCSDALRRSRQ